MHVKSLADVNAMLTSLALLLLVPAILASMSAAKDVLKQGSPESVGLLSGPLQNLEMNVTGYMTSANYGSWSYDAVHPLYPGATVM
jgi:hypothetical protein